MALGQRVCVCSGDALGFRVLKFPIGHPSPPLGFPYSKSGAEYTTESAGDTRCRRIDRLLSCPMPWWPNQRLLPKNPSPVPWHLCRVIITWWKTTAAWVYGGKNRSTKASLLWQGPRQGLNSAPAISAASPSHPPQHGCSGGHHEKIPPHSGRKKRRQLSCGGKDSYYLLFKSGVTSGNRSMRKGNFKAERIWTLEIFIQKWCLPVSCTRHGQTHPAIPGRLQKGPFSVAEQKEAGGLGGA